MPETLEATEPTTESLGWRAGLPDELKTNESFAPFKTVGEFAKSYLETKTKATDFEQRLGNSIPKLSETATDEDRSKFYDALGRPKDPKEYEFDGEDKNATEWTNDWKEQFHDLGLTKPQAKLLSQKWNASVQKMVEAHNVALQNEVAQATQALKNEYGDKYEANVELAKRLYQKHVGTEFDKDFDAGTEKTRLSTIKLLVKLAALTGEDRSPQGTNGSGNVAPATGINYSKSNMPPAKV